MKTTISMIAALALAGAAPALAAYQGGAVADGGTVAGTVKFQGQAPAPKKLDITKDKEVCAAKEHFDESIVVGSGGGLKNAVVVITNITKGKALDAKGATLDQKGCQYAPRVTLIPAGAPMKILNEDGILHNIHTFSKKNPPINRAQPKFKKEMEEKFAQPETFEVRCDAHAWMGGWVIVQDHPYYAITDDTGAFKLTDVPPGDYEIKVWHEKLGEQMQKVTVPAKGEAKADFSLAGK